jgi:bacterioferritin
MKGDAKVIEYLNKVLLNELTAINQYWLHYRMLEHWGVAKLAERIFFLDGLPNFQNVGKLRVGETVEEILRADLAVEMEAVPVLKDAIAHCEIVRDFNSRELFEEILDSEEEHIDFLEKQFDLIERMGIENYIQLQSKPAGE